MEDSQDQQIAVLTQLNMNTGNGRREEAVDSSWEVKFSSTSSSGSSNGSEEGDSLEYLSLGPAKGQLEKDLEFLQKHASKADPIFLQSLLNSQADNPNRLEAIMLDVLNIPNAVQLIQEFRGAPQRAGEKRPNVEKPREPEEEPKRLKTKDTEGYLQQVREMFPDADGLFLISECQQLESLEDFSRFISTVMISGLYPKKEAVEYSPVAGTSRVSNIINNNVYRTSVNYSSEEEISSSGLTDTPRRRRKRKIKDKPSDKDLQLSNGLVPPPVDVIDIASDNTETYEPPDMEALQGIYSVENRENNLMEVEEDVPVEQPPWESSLVNDIDSLLQRKFGMPNGENSPLPGSSRDLNPRLSLPGRSSDDSSIQEKSLAEIIEESRHNRQRPADSRDGSFSGPSKSPPGGMAGGTKASEVSGPEVSTTSQPMTSTSEIDEIVVEENLSKKSDEWLDEQTANLIRIFPNTDPSYLRGEVAKMGGSAEVVNEFVISKLEKNDMPTRLEYEKKLEMEELQNRYTKNFSIEDFLKAIPDPWKYFKEENRQCTVYKSHSLCYLKTTFRKHYVRTIVNIFNKNNHNLYLSYQNLKMEDKRRCGRRSEFECNQSRPTTINIQFLQEVAFIENEEKIRDYLEGNKIARQMKFDEAKRTGSLLECQCCFDSEVMVEETFYCPKDHAFCKDCIVKSVEVEMGNGRYRFECLANCDERFTLACLQNVLKPELFSKVIQAIQMEEVRAAGIEDLVQCPFCNYATIMPPEEKVMTCLNPECLKESCRLCKELNHIPLRCDEVEKSEEVKMRTYIENKMTEALVRTCYKCGKKFVKEDGCNKMTCTCGAKMCYVCRKPVTDYSHFNGQGGTEYHKCPLYSKNDELHVDLVQRVGEEAKAEIMQANPHTKLLHDPTIIMPERTAENAMPGMNNGAALTFGLRAIRGIPNDQERERRNARREIRQNNARANRRNHHHHRQEEPETESDNESEVEAEEEGGNPHHHHHHHHYHRGPQVRPHRHIRQQAAQEDRHHHRRHHHHRHFPLA